MTIIPSPSSSTSAAVHVTLLTVLSVATLFCLYKSLRPKSLNNNNNEKQKPDPSFSSLSPPKLIYLSQTKTSQTLATSLLSLLTSSLNLPFSLIPSSLYDPDDLVNESLVVFVASTWDHGNPPSGGEFLFNWLSESENDFRAGSLLLSKCRFAVFGVGSRGYGEERFNRVGREIRRRMRALGAVEVMGLGEGDVDRGDLDEVFNEWSGRLVRALRGDGDAAATAEDDDDDVAAEEYEEETETDEEEREEEVVDLEDIAGKAPKRGGEEKVVRANGKGSGPKEMVTPVIRANLEKQGYKILGSHSGVKICRWTKAQLRGRGGCYKHSFYGIESHRCMEATPSLACANKCVFCWRHHTNPVGKNWQWKMDDALDIVNSAIEQHTKMIKQMKGVPGVKQERLTEGLTPRHCALSLVGEPIMYPEINTLVDELHRRRISTFLVTNAQFPDKIKMLRPITQLYVSVDAATKDSLKAIDRPLFSDFWERFLDSLKALQEKQQRTVYRLTLVKGWNVEDLDAYSSLFSVGNPDFVEIKGVTYCGSSATSKLTMENVPWHADVKAFSEALAQKSNGEYEVACEHVHSCCVLLAKVDKFKVNGQWCTWIDYEKFHDLVASGEPFSSKDYMAVTPSWAVYGADEGGFDPAQSRYKKERHHKAK